ncbi:CLUMA_CG006127, isoform A [Clunio marinus]|uniref:CLUMA_CG006127, isoform A n=1 Tax=Clunio marinus TaxID=568069 RepID=A0A1J1HWT4_9DIPT|nr:CLUMA_CG006127, isoform A [Clunio marinus]
MFKECRMIFSRLTKCKTYQTKNQIQGRALNYGRISGSALSISENDVRESVGVQIEEVSIKKICDAYNASEIVQLMQTCHED